MISFSSHLSEAVKFKKVDVEGPLGSINPKKYYEALGKLRIMMRTSVPAKTAADRIATLFVDGDLFDMIEKTFQKNPDADMRPAIKTRLKQLGLKDSL